MKKETLKNAIELSKEIISKLDESQLKEIEGGIAKEGDSGMSCYFFSCSGIESEEAL